jgi:rhodanese-related sulfurtransferase
MPSRIGLLLLALVIATGCAGEPEWRRQLQEVGIRFISARELRALLDGGTEVAIIDARDEVHYRNGHIPGAISIPAEDRPLAEIDVTRPKRLLYPERLPADPTRLLVFYCGGVT